MPSSGWKNGSRALARLARLLRILAVGLRFGLHEFIPRFARNPFVRLAARRTGEPAARRLREALETLGPIYVKFGQVLSTRRDLVPLDIADELAKLQDRVPPFHPTWRSLNRKRTGEKSRSRVRHVRARARGKRVDRPGAPRYAARRPRSRRQGAAAARREEIAKDVALLATGAEFVERLWPDGRRLSRARWWRSSRATSRTSST